MTPKDFFKNLDEMVSQLEQNPCIKVIEYKKNAPVSELMWNRLIEKYAFLNHPYIKELYHLHNGFYMHWSWNPDLTDEDLTPVFSNYFEQGYEICWPEGINCWKPFAKINFLSCVKLVDYDRKSFEYDTETNESFLSAFENEAIDIAYLNDNLLPFDDVGGDLLPSFVYHPSLSQPYATLGESNSSGFKSLRITDLSTYLSLILETRGIVEARERFFNTDELTDLPKIENWKEYHFETLCPSFFKI